MNVREIFALNLRSLRHGRGLSQEELAHLADIDRTYVSSLERCVYSPSIDMVDQLARVLGVEAADMLKTDGNGRPAWVPSPEAPRPEET